MENRELTEEELEQVVGGYEQQPQGSDTFPYNREGKCSSCKVLTWWNSGEKNLKVCPRCGGSWEYVRTGAF